MMQKLNKAIKDTKEVYVDADHSGDQTGFEGETMSFYAKLVEKLLEEQINKRSRHTPSGPTR
jgi:hypothetical protein